jgi:3-oxoacyl-[acyl-carrier protein] reductase
MAGLLEDKVALVTGAGRGIGREIALLMAAHGAKVVVNDPGVSLTGQDDETDGPALAVVREIVAAGGKAVADFGSVSEGPQARAMVRRAVDEFGRIDIVVNNAGILPPAVPVKDETEQTFDAVFGLLKGTYFSMQEAAKRLPDGGRIINISSSTTRSWSPGYSIYAGSKSAIEQFTRSLSRELGPRQITVNGVVPGLTDTDMIDGSSAAVREGVAKSTTLGRLGQPRDIADVVAFLASDEGRWITGQMVVANGGSNP